MEIITSRKNAYIKHLRSLAEDGKYRRETGEYVCDGYKLLRDALDAEVEITSVLWREGGERLCFGCTCPKQYEAPDELFDYASPMKNSPGPVFTCRIPMGLQENRLHNAIILEDIQDPGNIGTILRTANAFGISAVIMTGACADIYSPKAVRSSMGAIFRQKTICLKPSQLRDFLAMNNLKLYGALLSQRAEDIRSIGLEGCAVAVGSEGHGLSNELVSLCDGELIIPMMECSESLNAAVAASVIMWEMAGRFI